MRDIKKRREKVIDIIPEEVNGPVKKLFVDMLDNHTPKKNTKKNAWLREIFLNPRNLYQSRHEILALNEAILARDNEGDLFNLNYKDTRFEGMSESNLDYAKNIWLSGGLYPISWMLKFSPLILSNICVNFSSFKERPENIFLVSENLKKELEDQDRDLEINNILSEQTFYFEFIKDDTYLYGTKDRIKSVFFSVKKDIDSFFREEKTYLNGVCFCEGENKETKIFSLDSIEISNYKMFSDILDNEVGKYNKYATLKVNEDGKPKVIDSQSYIDLLPARDFRKRSLLKLILNLLVYIKSNEELIDIKKNPRPTGGKKKKEYFENHQTNRNFSRLSLDTDRDIKLMDKMIEHSTRREQGLIFQKNGTGSSLRRSEEKSEINLNVKKYNFKK
jgi:hypothetical protein